MIKLPGGLKITVPEPVDSRLILTKEEMRAVKAANMPDVYICFCKDDRKLYTYDKTREDDPETGRFVLYNTPVDKTSIAENLPEAITEAMTDNATAVKEALFNSEHFKIDSNNKIDLDIDIIQAIDTTTINSL